MMVKVFYSLLVVSLLIQFKNEPQHQAAMVILFGSQNVCTSGVLPKSAFKRFHQEVQDVLGTRRVSEVICTHKCHKPILQVSEKGDTAVLISGLVDLCYANEKDATQAFDRIVKASIKKDFNEGQWADFLKPGKIFGLDEKGRKVRVLIWNGCADRKRISAVFEAMKKENVYKRLLFVGCGGQVTALFEK